MLVTIYFEIKSLKIIYEQNKTGTKGRGSTVTVKSSVSICKWIQGHRGIGARNSWHFSTTDILSWIFLCNSQNSSFPSWPVWLWLHCLNILSFWLWWDGLDKRELGLFGLGADASEMLLVTWMESGLRRAWVTDDPTISHRGEPLKSFAWHWGPCSWVESFPGVHKTLGPMPSTWEGKKKNFRSRPTDSYLSEFFSFL